LTPNPMSVVQSGWIAFKTKGGDVEVRDDEM
jgi:hypothetical protein